MKTPFHRWRALVLLGFALSFATSPAHAAEYLAWHRERDRVDADIRSWSLVTLLENVAGATGWQIYLDPGATHSVSTRFTNQPSGDALRALLGNLNFVVLPETNGISSLYVFRVSQQQATRLVQAPARKTVQPIPNQVVVTLRAGSNTKIEDLARSLGAKIVGRMDAQNTYLLQFEDGAATQSAREQLEANPDVESVDFNFPVEKPPALDLSGGPAPDLQLKPKTNDGPCQLVIGLIDTAVQSLGANLDPMLKPSINVAGKAPAAQGPTHGTAMAETILRAIQSKTDGTTSVQIQPVDVYGANETSSTFDVASGIVQAVNNGANIINLSLGSGGDSQLLHKTITQVSKLGIPIFAAAGNEPVTTPTFPAAYPEVVGVTASDRSGKIASYANRGSFIKVVAPGDNVVRYGGRNYFVQGTSTATAFASGMAAGLADTARVCADQAQSLLQKSLTPVSIKP